LDSFAWIEYFNGTSTGARVQNLLESERVMTPAIVVAELSEEYKRLNREARSKYDFLRARTGIVPIEEGLARMAGEINWRGRGL
jgi:predicted nucleic acid-binding protein